MDTCFDSSREDPHQSCCRSSVSKSMEGEIVQIKSLFEKAKALFKAIKDGSISGVEAALEAGANVNGHPDRPFTPIGAATFASHAGIVKCLLDQGADPNKPVALELQRSPSATDTSPLGARALHTAACRGNVEIIRLLLNCSRTDPNTTDNEGRTSLMVVCSIKPVNVEVVRLLLQAGADQTLAGPNGYTPLHMVALNGSTHSVDMLYSGAPATLNRCTPDGMTPLCAGCSGGHESMVSKLLSLGAMQPERAEECLASPLTIAVENGFVGVVRVLINEGGILAVGGETALHSALWMAIRVRRPRMLRLLLTLDGHQGRSKRPDISIDRVNLLGISALAGYPAAVSILLEAGADENELDLDGRYPRDFSSLCLDAGVHIDLGGAVAISRMLQHGPAYRARSWTWPIGEEMIACGSGDGENDSSSAAGTGAATSVVLSFPPAVNFQPFVDAQIFWPNGNSGNKLFVRSIDRYCAKD